ncbi:MAG: hypothetical protein JWQ50_1396 [Caballeronia mineralivorans]|nr:hypothetical protein [Caballeronia mineralivorans]
MALLTNPALTGGMTTLVRVTQKQRFSNHAEILLWPARGPVVNQGRKVGGGDVGLLLQLTSCRADRSFSRLRFLARQRPPRTSLRDEQKALLPFLQITDEAKIAA